MLHGVADLLPTILFVPDPFGRLLCNSLRNLGICSSSNFCQRAQVNRMAMTAQRACARVRTPISACVIPARTTRIATKTSTGNESQSADFIICMYVFDFRQAQGMMGTRRIGLLLGMLVLVRSVSDFCVGDAGEIALMVQQDLHVRTVEIGAVDRAGKIRHKHTPALEIQR